MAEQVEVANGEQAGGTSAAKQVVRRIIDALTDTQRRALALVAEGKSIAEVADAVGANRGTVYRWMKTDPHFRAAYNAWQLEQRESCRAALLKCAKQAVERIVTMVRIDERVALKVVKELGLFDAAHPLHDDPERVQKEIDVERLEDEARLEQRRTGGPPSTRRGMRARAVAPEAAEPVVAPHAPPLQMPAPSGTNPVQEKTARENLSRIIKMDKVATTIG